MPEMECPRCGAAYEDFDGFGVVFCERCRFCQHMSRDLRDGAWVCGYCGDARKDTPDAPRE